MYNMHHHLQTVASTQTDISWIKSEWSEIGHDKSHLTRENNVSEGDVSDCARSTVCSQCGDEDDEAPMIACNICKK